MYLDFSKFNYNLIPTSERELYIKRDKEAYIKILNDWLEKNVNEIVDRKWEIEEILFIDEESDFIKLLKEAESLYEFGFYTSCIALIGTAAEDCTKFFAIRSGAPELTSETQYERLKTMINEDIIGIEQFAVLDEIRKIRNDCVHYNDRFKVKNKEELKKDSLTILNAFKDLIRIFFGFKDAVTLEKYEKIMEYSTKSLVEKDPHIKNFRDLALKQRNIMSQLFNIDLTIKPGVERISKQSIYRIEEIDFDFKEFTLYDMSEMMPVIVDLSVEEIEYFKKIDLKEQEFVYAAITSTVSSSGQTEAWTIIKLNRIEF